PRGRQLLLEFTQTPIDTSDFSDDLPVLNELRHRIVDPGEGVIHLHHHAEGDQTHKESRSEHDTRHHPYVNQIEMLPEIEQRIVEIQPVPIRAYGPEQILEFLLIRI